MNLTMQDLIRTVAAQADEQKQRLLAGAERRYQQRLDELQRSFAEECAEIRAEFGDVEPVAEPAPAPEAVLA